jgi:hypothetical protein
MERNPISAPSRFGQLQFFKRVGDLVQVLLGKVPILGRGRVNITLARPTSLTPLEVKPVPQLR